MIEQLKKKVDNLLITNQSNPKEFKKYQIIKQILNKKNCFLNMDIEYAYAILKDLQIPNEDIKKVYMQLIDMKSIK